MEKFIKKMDIIIEGFIDIIINCDNPMLCNKIVENCELKCKIIDLEGVR